MALHPTGLGKGLGALIRESEEAKSEPGVQLLALDKIEPNPRQPRRDFNQDALLELADSIRSQGLLQPILVRPLGPGKPGRYEIVAGERRWRAAQMAGLKEVPVHVRAFSEQETLIAALVENLQREDLNPVEEALGLQLLKDDFGFSQDDMAQKIGKSRSAIANSLRLLALPENIRADLAAGKLTSGHGRALLSVADEAARDYLHALILEQNLSVREAEGQAAVWKQTGSFDLSGMDSHLATFAAEVRAVQDQAVEEEARPGKVKATKPQSARLLEIQSRIGELFRIPVKVTGRDTKGKISFSYNSREELETLLTRLSALALEGREHAALSGAEHAVLTGAQHQALSGEDYPELSGADRSALIGTEAAMLTGADNSALSGQQQEALDAQVHAPLAGAEHPVLTGAEHEMLDGRQQHSLRGAQDTSGQVQQALPENTPDTAQAAQAEQSEQSAEYNDDPPQG